MTTRSDILDLLANGKITAKEAAELLDQATPATETTPAPAPKAETAESAAASAPEAPPQPEEPVPAEPPAAPEPAAKKTQATKGHWFRVRVRDLDTGKNKVSVNIPLGMLSIGFKIANRFTPELQGLDWDELQQMIRHNESGLLVDVQDEEDGEQVQIYID